MSDVKSYPFEQKPSCVTLFNIARILSFVYFSNKPFTSLRKCKIVLTSYNFHFLIYTNSAVGGVGNNPSGFDVRNSTHRLRLKD